MGHRHVDLAGEGEDPRGECVEAADTASEEERGGATPSPGVFHTPPEEGEEGQPDNHDNADNSCVKTLCVAEQLYTLGLAYTALMAGLALVELGGVQIPQPISLAIFPGGLVLFIFGCAVSKMRRG